MSQGGSNVRLGCRGENESTFTYVALPRIHCYRIEAIVDC